MIAVTPGVSADVKRVRPGSSAFGADVKSSQWNIDGLDRTGADSGDLSMVDERRIGRRDPGARAPAQPPSTAGCWGRPSTSSPSRGPTSSTARRPSTTGPASWVGRKRPTGRRAGRGADLRARPPQRHWHLSLGGPIVKDKLWFFAAAEFGRYLAFGPFEDSTLPNQKESTWDNFDLKLTAQLAQNHRLNLFGSDYEFLGPECGRRVHRTIRLERDLDQQQDAGAGLQRQSSGANTVLEVRVGRMARRPKNGDPRYPSGEPTLSTIRCTRMALLRRRVLELGNGTNHADDAEVILTRHADDFIKGDHEFRFGVQYSRDGGGDQDLQPLLLLPEGVRVLPRATPTSTSTGTPVCRTYYGGESESIGAFVTDSWTHQQSG